MPVVYGTHLPGLGEPASRLAKLVKQLSGGAIELDLKEPGDGTEPQEILDKVSRGSREIPRRAAKRRAVICLVGTVSARVRPQPLDRPRAGLMRSAALFVRR